MKADNVVVDWSADGEGRPRIEKVALGDFDCCLRLKGDKLLDLPRGVRLGNVMWRSPEAQAGKGIGKASDVFSHGLLVSEVGSRQEIILTLLVVHLRTNRGRNVASRLRGAKETWDRAWDGNYGPVHFILWATSVWTPNSYQWRGMGRSVEATLANDGESKPKSALWTVGWEGLSESGPWHKESDI